ncbi:MAG: hypothetical protein ACI4XJ_01840 [Eubacteriales bacterium]
MKKIGMLALSLAASILLSATAFAADVEKENIAATVVEGKERLAVTSAVSDYRTDCDMSAIFDCDSTTAAEFKFDEGEEKAVNVYTALSGRAVSDTFALMIGGESGTVVAVNVYGTNDSTLDDWYQLKVINPAAEQDGFKVFEIKEFARKYAYYRFEFILLQGDYFTLSELALYCDEGEAVVTKYISDGEVEAGTTPASIDIPVSAPAKSSIPLFDVFGIRFQ